MVVTTELSKAAIAVLRSRIDDGSREVTPENLEAYRELARAGIMFPMSGFTSGPEYLFRWTDEGFARRFELLEASVLSRPSSSLSESPSPHR